MGHDDEEVHRNDGIDEGKSPKSSVVSLAEFRCHVLEMEQICRDWLCGDLSDESFLHLRERGFPKRLIIQEISSPDDDFDWSTIPADVMEACNVAHSQYSNAWRLIHAVNETIGDLQSIGESRDDPIVRITIWGGYLKEFDFSHQRLSQFQSQNLEIDCPEPPAPTV